MPDENPIEVRLQARIAIGPEVSIIQNLSMLTATLGIPAFVNVLFKEGGKVKLILLLRQVHIAMPVKHSEGGNFVLSFNLLVDHRCLHDIVSIYDEEFSQEHGKGQNKDEHVILNDGIRD